MEMKVRCATIGMPVHSTARTRLTPQHEAILQREVALEMEQRLATDVPSLSYLNGQQRRSAGLERRDIVKLRCQVYGDSFVPEAAIQLQRVASSGQ